MKYLVTVADDFGLSTGVNNGSIRAYKEGIVTELTLMVNAPGSEEAIEGIKEEEIENVGIHLMLYDLNKDGKYISYAEYDNFLAEMDKSVLEERVRDEFKKFEDKLERIPSHISTHQYTHKHPKLYDVITEYALKHKLFLRKIGNQRPDGNEIDEIYKRKGVHMTDNIISKSDGTIEELSTFLINSLKHIEENTTTEMFFYPGYLDSVLTKYTTLTFNRYRDLQLVTNQAFEQEIRDLGFELVPFKRLG